MKVVWRDSCNGAEGTSPNPDLWGLNTTQSWQDPTEQQFYTTSPRNAYYDGWGSLRIKAIREETNGKPWSSAKLNAHDVSTQNGPQRWLYGLFQARVFLPTVNGFWPAFWLLGENGGPDDGVQWPSCGEIDIFELPYSVANGAKIYGGARTGKATDGTPCDKNIPTWTPPAGWFGKWHTHSLLWVPGKLEWFVDAQSLGSVTRTQIETLGGRWPFDHIAAAPILNLAVGGWAGTPDPSVTEVEMRVKYVEVWQ